MYHGELGGSELGNLTRLDNILNGLPSELASAKAQLDKLKASGIPYKKAETTDGKLIVRVNLKDKAAAQNAIRNNQTGLRL